MHMTTSKNLFSADGLDERSLDFLLNALEQSNLPGFDYYEYKRAVVTLLGMGIDETNAHKSAFATAATIGLTKEKLVETAGFYRNLLTKEKDKFDQALQNQTKGKVTDKQEEVKRLTDQIERHKAEIQRLQEEMAQYRLQIEQAESTVKTEQEKISKAHDNFERTHTGLLLQIDKDIEQIHKYL
jgi:chromosome segregation ATPase